MHTVPATLVLVTRTVIPGHITWMFVASEKLRNVPSSIGMRYFLKFNPHSRCYSGSTLETVDGVDHTRTLSPIEVERMQCQLPELELAAAMAFALNTDALDPGFTRY